MTQTPVPPTKVAEEPNPPGYAEVHGAVAALLEAARRASARAVNTVMTATYWEIGRRIVEYEQSGEDRAAYGEELLVRLAADLTRRFGRGFGLINLRYMRRFYLAWPQIRQTVSDGCGRPAGDNFLLTLCEGSGVPQIRQTASDESAPPPVARVSQTVSAESEARPHAAILQTVSAKSRAGLDILAALPRFALPWSHYVKLLGVRSPEARAFYEAEALRGGWTVRQLDRQVSSQFYERTLLSRDKAAMLRGSSQARPEDAVSPEEQIKDPLVLEFLDLKDEYSESDLEAALTSKLEAFLLKLGGDFAFIGRQRRLRVGDEWYRVDLLFFHRGLRCLVVIDPKLGKFTHADAGQMHLYVNYAREHWTRPGENPPVGLILCAQKDEAVAHYALEGLPNTVLAAEYRMALPDEKELAAEVTRSRRLLEGTRAGGAGH